MPEQFLGDRLAALTAELAATQAANATLSEALRVAREELEREHVRLAGCSVAALGWHADDLKHGDWAHSASLSDVVTLRKRMEATERERDDARARLEAARLAFLSIRRCTSRADSGGCETCQDEADLAIVAIDAPAPVPTRAAAPVPGPTGPADGEFLRNVADGLDAAAAGMPTFGHAGAAKRLRELAHRLSAAPGPTDGKPVPGDAPAKVALEIGEHDRMLATGIEARGHSQGNCTICLLRRRAPGPRQAGEVTREAQSEAEKHIRRRISEEMDSYLRTPPSSDWAKGYVAGLVAARSWLDHAPAAEAPPPRESIEDMLARETNGWTYVPNDVPVATPTVEDLADVVGSLERLARQQDADAEPGVVLSTSTTTYGSDREPCASGCGGPMQTPAGQGMDYVNGDREFCCVMCARAGKCLGVRKVPVDVPAKACEPGCGSPQLDSEIRVVTNPHWGAGGTFCSSACRDAGRPLRPSTATTVERRCSCKPGECFRERIDADVYCRMEHPGRGPSTATKGGG